MTYRPELDGLRAIAVLLVIFFHAGINPFSGGFVGVDVFFVISGYLITTIILSEKGRGVFSLVDFYERRARRILPPLFLIMFASLPAAWAWMLPSDLKDFSRSIIATSVFASNIFFWRESGYWDVDNELKPLIHTWSLSVEEQYYLLFPLYLMLMWRFRRRWIFGTLMLIAGLSLILAEYGSIYFPTSTFYLLPTRGWELAIGAIIAFYTLYRRADFSLRSYNAATNNALSLLGLSCIGYAVVTFDKATPFPGIYAVVPTIGTGLVIFFASPKTLVGRVLSAKILVGMGLISYSAYLWHQPLFAFARHISVVEPNDKIFMFLIALSIVLAYLSWKYVEVPFRDKRRVSKKFFLSSALLGTFAFAAAGVTGDITNGFISRFSKTSLLKEIESKRDINLGLGPLCQREFNLLPDCRTDDNPEIVVWGDSYAMHLVQGILASKSDAKIVQMTKHVCGPIFDMAPVILPEWTVSWAERCLQFTESVRKWLMMQNSIKYAVLSSPFYGYMSEGNSLLLRDGEIRHANFESLVFEFERTLQELESMGIKPVIFSPPPGNYTDLGRCLARAEWQGMELDKCNFPPDKITAHHREVYRFLDIISKKYSVIRLDSLICDNTTCRTHIGTDYIYRDKGHLSKAGSAELGREANFYGLITGDPLLVP